MSTLDTHDCNLVLTLNHIRRCAGSPLPPATFQRRAGLNFHILTAGAEACDDTQVKTITAGIADAKKLANVAITTLKGDKMENSNGFIHLFGKNLVTPAAISKRFAIVEKLEQPAKVTSLDAFQQSQNDVVFTCIPESDPKAKQAYANVANLGKKTKGTAETPTVNLIRLTPKGIANPESFTEAAARIKAGTNVGLTAFKLDSDGNGLPSLAFTLVHEVQHCIAMLGGEKHFKDQKAAGGNTNAVGINQVQLMPEATKQKNPQNYAWFALLVRGCQPRIFDADCAFGEKLGGVPAKPATAAAAPGSPKAGSATKAGGAAKKTRDLDARAKKPKVKAKKPAKPKAPVKKAPAKPKPVPKKPAKPKAPAKKVPAKPKPVTKKPAAKAKAPVAPKKTASKAPVTPAKKVPTKSVAKPATPAKKVPTKAVAKPATKTPTPKAPVKPTKKVPKKAVAKPTTKKPVSKAPAPPAKKVPAKSVAKPTKKPTSKAPVKPAKTPVAKAPVKSAKKPVTKAPVKTTKPASAPPKSAKKTASKAPATPAKKLPTKAPVSTAQIYIRPYPN
ncbi:hypothetical protein B0H17DRAFT_1212145 [Mycena rosella]|uniref:Lysine-specific metallo-endopeptidase domain-containing protein n=1 Tax=Mycena rosella TaxID=1033263 RepID=A0AAD7CSM7_MYCRO|nr:hypothetical protein B0H17DRAFT_1212145 [Mycena rosella]